MVSLGGVYVHFNSTSIISLTTTLLTIPPPSFILNETTPRASDIISPPKMVGPSWIRLVVNYSRIDTFEVKSNMAIGFNNSTWLLSI